jgi:hypothetical protein
VCVCVCPLRSNNAHASSPTTTEWSPKQPYGPRMVQQAALRSCTAHTSSPTVREWSPKQPYGPRKFLEQSHGPSRENTLIIVLCHSPPPTFPCTQWSRLRTVCSLDHLRLSFHIIRYSLRRLTADRETLEKFKIKLYTRPSLHL